MQTAREQEQRWTALTEVDPGPVSATALAALLERGLAGVSPEGLLDLLVVAERLVAWTQSMSLTVVGELAQSLDRDVDPAQPQPQAQPHPQRPGPAQELAAEVACLLAISNATALGKVRLAAQLRRLPAVAEALARGRIDLATARALCEETEHLDPDAAAEAVDRVLPHAGGMTAGRVRSRCRAAAMAADPEASRERRARNQRTRRDVTLQPGRDGVACVAATLTETEAAELFARVQQAAHALVAGDRAAGLPARRIAQARADAFLALTSDPTSAAAPTPEPAEPGSQPAEPGCDADRTASDPAASSHPGARIGITVPLAALVAGLRGPDDDDPLAWTLAGLDRPELGEITGIGPVSADEAADAAFRALKAVAGGKVGIHFIVTDHTGRAVATTGTTYTPPPLIRAAVEARDRTCRFPGCTRPATRCDLDHTVPYPHGQTDELNLAALCRHHHRLKTHSGWHVGQDPDGVLTWTSPLGRTYRTEPATWTEPFDLPDQLALPPDPDLDSWPDDDAWLDDLSRRACNGLHPDDWVLAG